MESAKNDLIRYLVKTSSNMDNTNGHISLSKSDIQKFGLAMILFDELKSLDQELYIQTRERIKHQKILIQVFSDELAMLNKAFSKAGIKFVYQKGLALSTDLYEHPEYRKSADIDILIGINDLEAILDILGEMNYNLADSGKAISRVVTEQVKDSTVINNIGGFQKSVNWKGKPIQFELDLHISLFHKPWREGILDARSILDRSQERTLYDQNVRLMELHDVILHLFVHFTDHYLYVDFVSIFFNGKPKFPDIYRLYDVALLIDKYHSNINWQEVVERAKQFGVSDKLAFALRIFGRIFPNRVSEYVIDTLQRYQEEEESQTSVLERSSLPLDSLLPQLMSLDPDVLIHTELSELITNILPRFRSRRPDLKYPLALRFTGLVDILGLQLCLDELVLRHPALRAKFAIEQGYPVRKIDATRQISFQFFSVNGQDPLECETETQRLIAEILHKPFDLTQEPFFQAYLLQLDIQNTVLLLIFHSSIIDDYSQRIFIQELSTLYTAYCSHQPSLLPDLGNQYAALALRQSQIAKNLEISLAFWEEELKNSPPFLSLPTDRRRTLNRTFYSTRYPLYISPELTKLLDHICQAANVSLESLLLTTFKVFLFRYTGQEDILVGMPITQPASVDASGLIGTAENTLVLRTDLSGNPTFQELLGRVHKAMHRAQAHSDVPTETLLEAVQSKPDRSYHPLFQVMFSLQETPLEVFQLSSGLTMAPIDIEVGMFELDLALTFVKTGQGLKGFLEYNPDIFEAATVQRMKGHIQTLLEGFVKDPSQHVSDISILTNDERQQILVQWNDTHANYPQEKCIPELFEAQVELTPDAIAVVYKNRQLTYRELNEQSNQLAHYLRKFGVGPNILVGICVERSSEMVIGILGILKAGGAYVPLDPSYPYERLRFIVEDASIPILINQQQFAEILPVKKGQKMISLDADWESISKERRHNLIDHESSSNNLAYVIYTSGSTGMPKGVQIPHRSVVNFLNSMQDEIKLKRDDSLLSVTTLSFDIAGLEIFLPLVVGAKVIIANREETSGGYQLLAKLKESKVAVMQATPATWQMLLWAGWEGTPGLRMLCGGETMSRELAQQLLARGAILWNLYGPTETTIWSTVYKVVSEDGPVPIGHPIANTQIYILDEYQQPVPIGVRGELYIGGVGVGRGYFNQLELTDEKFMPNPFSNEPMARIYRTGDSARYRADGAIEFLGRMDYQVKIRGYRIELGEIEAILNTHPTVQEAIVLVRENATGDQQIVAYTVLCQEEIPMASNFRSFLRTKLPEYMIPAAYITLSAFPLTPNGKVDRQALMTIKRNEPIAETGNLIAPRTSLEKAVAEIWMKVLGLTQVGIHNNFLELGGNSLQAIRIVALVQDVCGITMPAQMLFDSPTIAELTRSIVIIQELAQDHFDPTADNNIDSEEGVI